MSRLIKIIDENTIELAEYRNPEAMFKSSENPPTLQNIKDEIEHLEWYCTFKAIINPFQMYVENERLNNRVSELEKAVSRKEEQITDLDDENFDLENEIERLNNDIKVLLKENENKEKVIKVQDNIIKEVRAKLYDLNYKIKEINNVPFDISEIFEMIEILDKGSEKE